MDTLKKEIGRAIVFLFFVIAVGVMTQGAKADDPLTFDPPVPNIETDLPDVKRELPPVEASDYKTLRLREMADMWVGTVLEPHTVKLLAMLLTEDGTITAERRHDCNTIKYNGRILKGCFAVGIMGHNICARGTPIVSQDHGKPAKNFCYDYAMTDFEKEYPGFSTDWRIQFQEYTVRMTDCINSGKSVNRCIQAWNSREAGRIAKVQGNEPTVRKALGF